MSSWLPVTKDHVTSGLGYDDDDDDEDEVNDDVGVSDRNVNSKRSYNALENVFLGLAQCTNAFICARFIFNPLYMKRGIAASIGAHMAMNAFATAMQYIGRNDSKKKKNEMEEEN